MTIDEYEDAKKFNIISGLNLIDEFDIEHIINNKGYDEMDRDTAISNIFHRPSEILKYKNKTLEMVTLCIFIIERRIRFHTINNYTIAINNLSELKEQVLDSLSPEMKKDIDREIKRLKLLGAWNNITWNDGFIYSPYIPLQRHGAVKCQNKH